MKKVLPIVVMLCLLLWGCSKSSDEKSLTGTTWKFEEKEEGYSSVHILKFFSDTQYSQEWTEKVSGAEDANETWYGTYTYKHPDLQLNVDGEVMNATVTENTIQYHGGDNLLFIKQ